MNLPENMTLKATVEHPSSASDFGAGKTDKRSSLSDLFSWPGRIALLLALVLSPWAFASVENWAQCLITISLLVGLGFWWFETALNRRDSQIFPYIALLVFWGLALGLFQTLSLPDWIAEPLLGRQKQIYGEFTGSPDSKLSVSVFREGTWNQIRLLTIALSGLLLGCRYFRTKRDIVLLFSVIAVNGLVIGFFGIIHKLTGNGKMYWLYDIAGGPFGPFVNRNNAAGYLLMCLACCLGLLPIVMARKKNNGPQGMDGKDLPIWNRWSYYTLKFVSEMTATKMAVLLCAILIAAAIPTTLSRGGVVGLLVASIGTILVYGMARKPKNFGFVFVPLIALGMALFGWIGFGDELLKRFDRIDIVDVSDADSRVRHWQETWPAVGDMGALGAGLGTYKNVHRLYRTSHEKQLFVYAENQYFQSVVEAGWGGLALFLLAWLLAYHYAALTLFKGSSPTTIGVGTMGAFLVFSQATASLFDFGLYIPSNMLLLSVLIGFLAYHSQALATRLKATNWLSLKIPNYLVQFVVLMMFAGATMVAIDLNRRAGLDKLMRPGAVKFDRFNMNLEATDARIASLTTRVMRAPTVKSLNYAGELWMHRSRLALFEELCKMPEYESAEAVMDEKEKEKLTTYLWNVTNVQQMQETVFFLQREQSKYQVARFLAPFRDNLRSAASYFLLSRQIAPLQPLIHLRIGEIRGVISEPRAGDDDIERALRLAPSNATFRKVAGIYYLQSGNVDGAVTHLRRYLELMPERFSQLMRLIKGMTSREIVPVDEDTILRIIPADGSMLYGYVQNYMSEESQQRERFLERAAQAVEQYPVKLRENDILLGDIKMAQNEDEEAILNYRAALRKQPNDPKTRYKRAQLLVELGRLDEAWEDAEYLKSHAEPAATYNGFLEEVESKIKDRDKDSR